MSSHVRENAGKDLIENQGLSGWIYLASGVSNNCSSRKLCLALKMMSILQLEFSVNPIYKSDKKDEKLP